MNTKLIVALIALGVITVALIGVVFAQIATTPSPIGAPNEVQNSGFWGWMGRCLGFRGAQYYGVQAPIYIGQPANITVTDPNTGQITSHQGYYGYRGGGCMRGFYP